MADFSGMKVAELKDELKQRGLSVSGKKADLLQRLTEATEAPEEEAEEVPGMEPETNIVPESTPAPTPAPAHDSSKAEAATGPVAEPETVVESSEAETPKPEGPMNAKARRARRRLQKKKKKGKSHGEEEDSSVVKIEDADEDEPVNVEVEYIAPMEDEFDPAAAAFADVFSQFLPPHLLTQPKVKEDEKKPAKEEAKADTKPDVTAITAPESDDPKEKSRRAKKRDNRLGIAELKQLVSRPDVVEVWDTTATDPRTLVYLKGYRNTVPVPRHWCQKRKYLQGKRGIEKPPFHLPEFIEATGIRKMRETGTESKEKKTTPRLNKIDINYQVLHDAFFRFQTKPPMTIHGDIYYEGREFETTVKEKRPGAMSDALKEALGMGENSPVPWLVNMQRYGPPPAYPNLRIQGLNAPLPSGGEFGYGPGQWGQPPIDEYGRPLYGGNPFDPAGSEATAYEDEKRDTKRWGLIEEEESSEEEEEEEEAEEEEDAPPLPPEDQGMGIATPAGGVDSVMAGMQTPDAASVDLRKTLRAGKETPMDEGAPQLYQVLDQKSVSVGDSQFGSDKQYQVPTQSVAQLMKEKKKDTTEKIAVSLNPDELENMDEQILKSKYAQEMQAANQREDEDEDEMGDIKKRKRGPGDSRQPKRQREFKF